MAFANKRIDTHCAMAPPLISLRRRNAKCGLLALLVVVILFSTTSAIFAQVRGEALWRVDNNLPSRAVPLYDGEPSPFPIKEPPPPPEPEEPQAAEVVVNPEPVLTPAQRAAQRRAGRARSLLSRIREMLANNNAFGPDFSSVVVDAIVSGKNGGMALIKDEWRFKGDYIKTSVLNTQSLMGLLLKLQQADNNLARMVETEIRENREEIGPFNLLIKNIDPTGVTLRLPDGGSHVITFNSKGW